MSQKLYNKILNVMGRDGAASAEYSIQKGMNRAKGLWVYSLTAPLVVPIALLWCKWDSEKLPNWARKWDNNVNLNGDNGDWLDVDANGDPDTIQMPLEDTPEVRARCYWGWGPMEGKIHPRSFLARWIWIGFRNRGKQAFVDKGVHIERGKKLVTTGEPGIRGQKSGAVVRELDGYFHYHAVTQVWKYFCLTEQRGWKVQNLDAINRVAIPVSYRAIKLWK